MAGVLLGKTPNARGRRVWLPPGTMRAMQSEVIKTCLVVTDLEGTVCGAKFTKGQEALAETHTTKCLKEHGDTVAAFIARRRPEGMKSWDPEFSAWLSVNARGIAEGRVKW